MILSEEERERFRGEAEAEGISLSEWLRRAARERLERVRPRRLASVDDLQAFFAACDERERGTEPDWDEHLAVIDESRRRGLPTL